jgi:hypothetical protein
MGSPPRLLFTTMKKAKSDLLLCEDPEKRKDRSYRPQDTDDYLEVCHSVC